MKYKLDKEFEVNLSELINNETSKDTKFSISLKASWIDTPIGKMIGISDNEKVHLLEFADRASLRDQLATFKTKTGSSLAFENSPPLIALKKELELYFSGKLKTFKTPVQLLGSTFQKDAWHALTLIPFGETASYLRQAGLVGKEKAFRAVAGANNANRLAIIIPCHRIINKNGALGGYKGGLSRKEWLLDHEKCFS